MLHLRKFDPTHQNLVIGVLMGGTSAEREVSLKSGTAVAAALVAAGFTVKTMDLTKDALPSEANACDVIFPALHGGFGENGGIQELLDQASLTYVGSGPQASRVIMDKERSKERLRSAGLPVPTGCLLTAAQAELPAELDWPVIVKPNAGGSSVALNIVRHPDDWDEALETAFAEEDEVLVEELLTGPELTVGLIDGEPLMPVEILPPGDCYDYDAKYTYAQGKTEYFCPPANIASDRLPELRELGQRAGDALGARDLLRVDMMFDRPQGTPRILEANSIPGFTATSLLPKAAAQAGISFEQLCTHLVLTAADRR